MNSADNAGWFVSPDVRSSFAADGALLIDIKDSRCYSLNGVAAHAWVTIEGSPKGISFEGIVDALETHFPVTQEELEQSAKDCLAELQLAGLAIEKEAAGDESYVDRISSLSKSEARDDESRNEGGRTMICEQPFVQRLETLESIVDRLFPQGVESNMDWRAKKLKTFIDNSPGKVNGSLGHVCSQLQLSLSDRQARRLFKDSAGISMKEYARKRRLVFAAKRLQNTDEPIKAIATDAGYHTHHGFRKGFLEMFRLTPVEFRKFWRRSQVAA